MKDSKSKAFLTGAVLLFAALLAMGCWVGLRKGVEIGDSYFYRTDNEVYKADSNNYFKLEAQGEAGKLERASIVLGGKEQTAELRWNGAEVTVTFSDGTVISGTWGNGMLLDAEGMPAIYSEEYLAAGAYGESEGVGKAVISDALCKVSRGAVSVRGSAWLLVLGAVLYVWGAVVIWHPEASFFFLNRWRYRDAELSEAGKAAERLGGAAILIAGAVFLSGLCLLV